jgi:hypothetical protein
MIRPAQARAARKRYRELAPVLDEQSRRASATAFGPGENELRVDAGSKPNEQDAQCVIQTIRDARGRADLVMV